MLIMLAALVAVPTLMLGVILILDGTVPSGSGPMRWLRGWKIWHIVLATILAALVFAIAEGGSAFPVLLLALAILFLFLRAWHYEFLFLMSLSDDDFPGRHDKLIWAAVLTAFAPIGVWMFRSFRHARWPAPETVKATPASELA